MIIKDKKKMMFNLEGHLRPLLFIVVWQLCKSWTFLRTTSLVRDKHYELNKVKKKILPLIVSNIYLINCISIFDLPVEIHI